MYVCIVCVCVCAYYVCVCVWVSMRGLALLVHTVVWFKDMLTIVANLARHSRAILSDISPWTAGQDSVLAFSILALVLCGAEPVGPANL